MENASPTRRDVIAASAMLAVGVASPWAGAAAVAPHLDLPPEDFKVSNNRIHQSAMGSVLTIPPDVLIDACHKMGMPAVESIGNDPKRLARVRGLGMHLGYIGSHGFAKGPLDPANHAECEAKLRAGIDLAAQFDSQNVITFTGYRVAGISDEQAKRNCVEFWKKIIPYAEEKKVNLILEILNTRDDTHPMKGHPGYFGNDVELCVDLIKRVDSPRMKLLFDIYHVQIMNGDVIRRIRQHKDYIAHVHTAGVPGRCELDDTQELNYPSVMRALLEIGYTGFVAQEFIPTWPDKVAALRHAVRVCDV
ncbi:MAG: Sugar phosphate isomerase [Phycisphaerales bacterium]|nr:Sugar phosphate isomerase [Phycisphaerales bacterium]